VTRTIHSEIRQTRPFRSLQEQLLINLMRTSRAVEESWLQYLKRTEGLSLSQYNILRILRGARPDAVKISEVGERMIYRDPDVTRLVDRLVRQGLARRQSLAEDRRVVLVEITEEGLELLERLDEQVDRYTRAVMAGLSPQQLRTLDVLLNEIRAGMQPFP
jgi:DNA-binding MarR family transcriptional regulator